MNLVFNLITLLRTQKDIQHVRDYYTTTAKGGEFLS
jgi:hypothetical protein